MMCRFRNEAAAFILSKEDLKHCAGLPSFLFPSNAHI